MNDLLSRRDIIKTFLVTTATSLLGNKAWGAKTISEVTANIDPNVGVARIILSAYPALESDGGSVRLGSSRLQSESDDGGINVTPVGLYYPIVISRISASEYVAVDTMCRHAGSVVAACVGGLNGRMICPYHGSEYDIRGKIQPDFEANEDLINYETSLSKGILSVQLPEFGMTVMQTNVMNESEKRMQLSWFTVASTEYEVRWRPNLSTEPVAVSHFPTPSGTTASNVYISPSLGGTRSVYVIPQDGIYQIAIRQRQV